jgi:hypothetical protein
MWMQLARYPPIHFGIYEYLSWACECMIMVLGRGTAFLDLDVM